MPCLLGPLKKEEAKNISLWANLKILHKITKYFPFPITLLLGFTSCKTLLWHGMKPNGSNSSKSFGHSVTRKERRRRSSLADYFGSKTTTKVPDRKYRPATHIRAHQTVVTIQIVVLSSFLTCSGITQQSLLFRWTKPI